MAEIITEPDTEHVVHHVENDSNSNALVLLIGVALVIVTALIFFFYALPIINRAATQSQVNVPDEVDVNINRTQ